MTKEELQAAVKLAESNLDDAEYALLAFEQRPANNVFETLHKALGTVEDIMLSRAGNACSGAYNCGMPTYEQGFIVNGVEYLGSLKVEYNRHDKTYYYIEGSEFSYVAVKP